MLLLILLDIISFKAIFPIKPSIFKGFLGIFGQNQPLKGLRNMKKSARNNIMRVILFRMRDNIRGGVYIIFEKLVHMF